MITSFFTKEIVAYQRVTLPWFFCPVLRIYLQNAIKISEVSLGIAHFQTTAFYIKLEDSFEKLGRKEEAQSCQQKASMGILISQLSRLGVPVDALPEQDLLDLVSLCYFLMKHEKASNLDLQGVETLPSIDEK